MYRSSLDPRYLSGFIAFGILENRETSFILNKVIVPFTGLMSHPNSRGKSTIYG